MMVNLVKTIAQALVDNPEEVSVESREENGETIIDLRVATSDMGKIIGKQGRIAKALRTVVKAIATKEQKKVRVDIVE